MWESSMLFISFLALLLLTRVQSSLTATAFVHRNHRHHQHHHHLYQLYPSSSLLFSSSFRQDGGGGGGGGDSRNDAGGGTWKTGNDFHHFLNQCTVQTFLIVLHSIRDPQTVRWVNNFTAPIFYSSGKQRKSVRLTGSTRDANAITGDGEKLANPPNEGGRDASLSLLKHHGIGVMNTTLFPTWDSYFCMLLQQPAQSLLVQSYNGLGKDYEVDINPASLCTRMIAIREQIAAEFANDLGVIANSMGQHTMDSYYAYMQIRRQREDDDKDDDENGTGSRYSAAAAAAWRRNSNDEATMSSGADGSPRILPPHNLVFLDYALDPINGHTPSPLRKGNFDLLVLLATQESIVRILNKKNPEKDLLAISVSNTASTPFQKYLKAFYAQRMDSHFSGIQRYGRADDFLEELLFYSSPRAVTEEDDGSSSGSGLVSTTLVDPVRLTEMILNERRLVALEWQTMSKNVPNDHISIRRLQLERLMQSYS